MRIKLKAPGKILEIIRKRKLTTVVETICRNQLQQPIVLSDAEVKDYRAKPFQEKGVQYIFPEDVLPRVR